MEQSRGGPLGLRVQGTLGLRDRNRRARRRPISKSCCAAARTSSGPCCPGNLGGKGFALIALAALAIWGFSGFFQVEPDELGVVHAVRQVRARCQAGPQLSPAVSGRDGADAEGHARQPHRYRHAPGRGSAPRHHDAQRAGGEPDAHRRREHRRCRLLGVLADQADGRERVPVQHPESRRHREGGGRKRHARGRSAATTSSRSSPARDRPSKAASTS